MDYAIHTILCATDLGPRGLDVLRHAAGLARHFGSRLQIVYAIELLSEFAHFWINTTVPEDIRQNLGNDSRATVRQALEQRLNTFCQEILQGKAERLHAEIQIIEGPPASVILQEAQRIKADLIVLGSHGHSAIGEAVLGSVAHKITMKTTTPVLLVPIGSQG